MKEIVSSLFFLGVGLFYLIYAWEYEAGSFDQPGPALFPWIIGSALIISNALLLFLTLRRKEKRDKWHSLVAEFEKRNMISAVLLVGAVMVYLALLEYAGFLIASPFLIFFLAWILGGGNWVINLVLGVVSSGFIYWLFWIMMRVPIPAGTWGR